MTPEGLQGTIWGAWRCLEALCDPFGYTRMDLNVVHLLREDISKGGLCGLFHWSPSVGRAWLQDFTQ